MPSVPGCDATSSSSPDWIDSSARATTASMSPSRLPKWCSTVGWDTPTAAATSCRRMPPGPTSRRRSSVASRMAVRASSEERRRRGGVCLGRLGELTGPV